MKIKYNNIPKFGTLGNCHFCKKRTIIVGCYLDYNPVDCKVMYCLLCLKSYFNEDICEMMDYRKTYECPYKRNICSCNKCKNDYEPALSNLTLEDKNNISQNITKMGKLLNNINMNYQNLNKKEKQIVLIKLKQKLNRISKKLIEYRQ